jgi:HD-like signal output (HDOD) protein
MAGLLHRIKSLLSKKPGTSNEQHHADGIEVLEPVGFSISQCQHDFYRSIFGESDASATLSVPQRLVLDVTTKTLQDKNQRLKAVPRLPSVIPRLLQSLRNPNSSAKDYVDIINKDPAMSAAVLKLANSVYFNPREKRISGIEIAVVKLGIDGLRSVLSAAVMQPVIRCKSSYFSNFGHKLWDHSLCCAVSCEIIARQRGLEPYKAYLLGLVHDIGKITLFSELSTQFNINNEPNPPGYSAFVPLMSAHSAKLTHTIAEDWQLPIEISSALEQQVDLQPGQQLGPYAHLLYQANLACEIYMLSKSVEADDSLQDAIKLALQQMTLPPELFQQLDSLSVQVD